jgi:type II restriction enzyme
MLYDSNFISKLNKRAYWVPTRNEYTRIYNELNSRYSPRDSVKIILNQLSSIMDSSRYGVSEIQQKRFRSGLIENISQSTMSVAGKNYEALVGYSLEMNRIYGNLPRNIIISLVTKRSRFIGKYATINIGNETQQPDVDLAIYKETPNSPIIICSTKTSLRERAGQSYKWKLLLDISRCNCEHDDGCPLNNYQIEYPAQRDIYMFFITADFYNEIHQPQQRGMFAFFDGTYVSKDIENTNYIKKLSDIIEDISNIFN